MRDFRHSIHSLARYFVLLSSLVLLSIVSQAVFAASSSPPISPGQTATLLPNGHWLLLGRGEGGHSSNHASLFDSQRGSTQTLKTKLIYARTEHSATLLPDGRVLILGGLGPDGALVSQPEIFDPTRTRFERPEKINLTPRTGHTATVLTDGRVLIVGGVNGEDHLLNHAELWDPRNGKTQILTHPNTHNRRDATARLMPDGNVLYLGGVGTDAKPSATAIQYRSRDSQFEAINHTEATRQIKTVDQATASKIVATLPQPDSEDFLPDGTIALRFSAPVDVTTLNEHTVFLIGPQGAVKATIVPAQDGMLLFVTPTMSLLPGARHTLFLDGIVSTGGVPLGFQTLDFGTAALNAPEGSTPDTSPGISQKPSTGILSITELAPKTKKNPPSAGEETDDETFHPGPEHRRGRWRTGKTLPEAVRALLDHDERVRTKIEARRARDGKTRPAKTTARRGATGIAGTVLKLNDQPLANVTVSIDAHTVRTDANGHFQLTGLTPGRHELIVDGSSANQPGREYIQFVLGVDIKKGTLTELPHALYVARIKAQDWAPVGSPAPADTVITHPNLPGLEIHIPKGTILRDRQGKILTRIAIVPVALDRAPFPTPENFPIYFMLHPGGAIVQGLSPQTSPGIRIVYPNYSNDAPGTKHNFWLYDPRERGWFVYGSAMVNAEGTQIVPEPGVGLHENMAAGHSPPAGPEGPEPPIKDGDDNPKCGDPVDCQTGVFLHTRTDVLLPDVLPVVLTRTYRPGDTRVRPFGIGTSHHYAMYLRNGGGGVSAVIQVVLPNGARFNFKYKSGTNLHTDYTWEHTDSTGRFYGALMTAPTDLQFGEVYRMTLKDGSVYDFALGTGALVRMKDRFDNRLTFTWSGGQLQRIVSPNGRYLDFTYDTTSRITQIRDLTGRTWSYTYNLAGYLERATVPGGTFEEYTYDTAGRMLTVRDRRGNTMVTNVYDANGRVERQTLAGGAEGNGVWQFAYVTDFYNNVLQTTVTKPRGNVIRFTWDGNGYLGSATGGVGTVDQRTTTYDRQPGSGLLTATTDALGRRTERFYDAQGNVTRLTFLADTPLAQPHRFTYEPVYHQLASYTDPLGKTTVLNYDASSRLSRILDPLGNTLAALTYNEFGQPLTIANGAGNTTRYTYDLGDLAAVTDPLGRTTQAFLDTLGRALAITDPLGRRQRYVYDDLDRLTQITDALGNLTTLAYDNNDNLTGVTDARNGQHRYAYDAKNRLSTQTDPLNRAETFQYDGNDNLIRYTDRKLQMTNFDYGSLDRRERATFPDTTVASYVYDAGNRLRQAHDPGTGTSASFRTYDDLNRLTRELGGGAGAGVTYTYDERGLRTGFSTHTGDYQNLLTTTYDYDDARRLTRITQGTASISFTYDAAQRRRTVTLPTGIVATYDYDAASQLIGITYQNGATAVGNLTYSYDLAGNRTEIGGSLARTNLPAALSAATYNAANQITSWNGQSLTHDANGNLLSDGTKTYTWDARNRLTAIAGAVTASFQYDAFGRRIRKTVNGTSTVYQYDGLNVVRELASATPLATHLTGLNLDEVFRRTDHGTNTSHDFLTDALGSVLALTDSSGAVQTSYTYEPFGNTSLTGSASSNPVQYTGRENDGTGLYYYRARYYDPKMQRFISSDPIGLEGGLNTYSYVGNSPLMYIDPYGLWFVGDPLPQGLVDAATGFGDGVYEAITLGLGDLQDIRDLMEIDGGIDKCSGLYGGLKVGGNIVGGLALGGAAASKAGLSAWARRYPNAGGGGVGINRFGQNLIRADWHKFKSEGQIVNRPHIDIPGVVKHWPWK